MLSAMDALFLPPIKLLCGAPMDGQYGTHNTAGFIGLIMFTSEDASLLPLTTTKRSVDSSSAVYRRAKPRMRDVTKQWVAYTNARKQGIEDAKKIEAKAKPLSIFNVPKREIASFPNVISKPREKSANIHYSMPTNKVRELAESLGNINMPYREVGVRSFDYTYEDIVGEE